MLVICRKERETILIGKAIRITILAIKGKRVILGIQAPPGVKVLREELAIEEKEGIDMPNIFSFQLKESFLQGYADYLKQLREMNPGKTFQVTISVDLIPDGTGYAMREPPQISIDEVTEEAKTP